MRKFYYYLTTVVFFLAFVATNAQPGCNSLEITTTQDGAVCGPGMVRLEATSSGTGDGVLWYDAATGGDIIGQGNSIYTPEINTTTSYWAAEANFTGGTATGLAKPTYIDNDATSGANWGLVFTANDAFTLVDVEVYSTGSGGNITVQLQDDNGNMIEDGTFTIPGGGSTASPIPVTLPLNFDIPSAGQYRLINITSGVNMIREFSASNSFPYSLGAFGEVTSGYISGTSTTYYWFYNWTIGTLDVVCESPRVEAIATVNNIADEDIATLPYTHTANTSSYDNNYAGNPGSDCGTGDEYLYGYDVVYKYTADNDYILQVDLTNVSENYTGIFVYEDCADIGDECAAEGSVSEIIAGHGFQMSVENGKDYYFVVSSAEPTDSFDYTLTINGTTCANYPAPTANATQDFVDGQLLSDLSVTGLDLTWYSDAALTNVLPEDTPLVDNTTYYVTQTFQTCESSSAAITVSEVACTALDVLTTTANSVCGEGSVILTAEGAEAVANTNIYWYDAATGGEVVGKGTEFKTDPLEQTTSFWAAEVALSGGGEETGLGKSIADAGSAGYAPISSGYGLLFTANEAFTLKSVTVLSSGTGGDVDIILKENDHSGQIIDSKTVTVVGGGSTSNPVPDELMLDFEIPNSGTYYIYAADGPNMIRDSGDSGYPYPLGTYGEITTGYSVSSPATAYYFFYDWTIGSEDIICESDRVEVIAEVNDVADEIVSTPLPYVHTANTADYGNNYFGTPGSACTTEDYLDGNDVVYQFSPTVGGVYSIELSGLSSTNAGVFVFESCYDIGSNCYIGEVSDGTSNDFGIDEVILNDGQDYFIVVSTKTSSSTAYTITIDEAQINCADYTAAPQGDTDQFSEIGDTLADLDVTGSNLTWYSDAALSTVIPDTTPTVDNTTYYVTQTLNGCESDALEITVHEVDCSDLEIVSTVGATIVCKGSAILEAQGSGTYGAEIYWYDAAVDGNIIGFGEEFTTNEIIQTESYWVSEVFLDDSSGGGMMPELLYLTFDEGTPIINHATTPVGNNPVNMTGAGLTVGGSGLNGTALVGTGVSGSRIETGWNTDLSGSFTIGFWTSDVAPSSTLYYIFGDTGANSFRCFTNGAAGAGNWMVRGGGLPDLTFTGAATMNSNYMHIVYDSNTGEYSGYIDGVLHTTVQHVPGHTFPTGSGFTIGGYSSNSGLSGMMDEFRIYDRALSANEIAATHNNTIAGDIICESPRVEVIAEVTQDGNEIVGTLPYSHSENTGTYGNNYSGTPGLNCGVDANYLNGSDVVYMFEATEDDLITIELTDLNQYYAGVFVYEVCGEIGDECAAGAVAGPSTNDVIIQDFPVVDGQTYYIVVSSWLTTDIDYTIKINSFSCADLETPTGDATQDFVAGDTVEDLKAEETRAGAVLTWYEDAALSIEITDTSTHLLVDGDIYYVTQTFNECESPALAITAEEIDCSDLEIVSFTDAEVACRGSVELQVVASGTGSEVYWYDAATQGNLIGMGNRFTTPELTQTTSYWAAEVYTEQGGGSSTGPLPTYCTPIFSSGCNLNDTIDDFILEDSSGTILISHLGSGCSVNGYGDFTGDNALTANLVAGSTYNFEATHGTSSQYVRIWIDLDGNGSFEDAGELVYESTTGGNTSSPTFGNFEIPQNVISGATVMRVKTTFSTGLSDSCTQSSSWGEVHDYKVMLIGAEVICESPRQEVVATINQSGDIEFDHTDLTYVDSNNTAIYGNNFTGDAGVGCDGANYLNGNEAMYYYSAHPTDDNILRIEVSNFSNPNTAVFVYESCGDVGIDCLAGATNDGGEILIEDYYVNAGEDLLIVVTSSTGSTDYTLTVEGVDCNNIAPPTGDAAPFFASGDVVSDLSISGSAFNNGFKWYSDAALTNEILDPTTEILVDGTPYYVTQTILGCESSGFEIIPIEFDCGLMNVLVQDPVYYVCAPGGTVSVPLTASGLGSDIYWYDQQTGGNIIGMGENFFANVTESTSFWVSEVFTKESSDASGPLPTYCTPTFSIGCTSSDYINDFILEDVSGTTLISHLGTGCSNNAYADYTDDASLTATLVAGGTYNFEATHGTSSQYIRIWIDLDGNGSFEDAGELLYESTTAGSTSSPTNGSFQIPQNLISGVSVMRVKTTWSTGASNSCTQSGSYGEAHDYKVILIGSEVVCESSREEIRVVMNEDVTPPPVVTPKQTICGESLLSDIIVLGTDIRWYDSNGTELSPNSPVVEGYQYYVTQTIRACESAMLEVVMDFTEKSDQPVAAINQAFETGQDLTDLEVFGDNLTWYADQWKVTPIPSSTLLSDQTTYYVTQTFEDMCESETLGITVHEILDVKDVLFEAFEFYPNPVDEVLFITNSHSIDQVDIYDLAGRKVYSSNYHSSSIEVDVTSLSTGTYLLKARVDDMEKIFRVIKK